MSAKHDLVNANLSREDRFARENSWVEADGTLSTFGRGAILQYLYEQNKTALVEAVIKARQTNETAEDELDAAQSAISASGN